MTNKRIQLSTNVDGQNVNVYPVTKSEFVEFSDGKTLNDKLNNMDGNHEHGLATPAKDGFMSKEDKAKLDGVNNYTHPSTHAATMITEDVTHRFVTDAEKNKWNNKADTTMASKTNAGLMSASDKQRIDGLNAEFKTRDDKITKNTEDIKSWNDEMINKDYQYFNGENITIENSIVSKTSDIFIKGRTLMNIHPKSIYRFNAPSSEGNKYTQDKSENSVIANITEEITSWCYVDCGVINRDMFKPNTKYTIIGEFNGIESVSLMDGTAQYSMTSQVAFNNNRAVVQIKSAEEINRIPNDIRIIIYCYNKKTVGTVSAKNVMILEGDWTNKPIPNYFESIKSFGQQENKISILSENKNFFNISSLIEYGKKYELNVLDLDSNTFTIRNHQDLDIDLLTVMGIDKNKLPISLSFSTETINGGIGLFRVFYKDGSNQYIGNSNGGKATFIINKAVDKLVFSYGNSGVTKYSNVQFEYGSNATEFQSPKINKKDILLSELGFDEGLRGLNDIVYDELNSIKNVVIKRVDKYIVTGNENFITDIRGDYMYCYFILEGSKPSSGLEAICNQFKYIDGLWNKDNPSVQGQEGFDLSGSNSLSFQLSINKLETHNTEGVKKYFKSLYDGGNPVEVYYWLAEPIEIPLDENINPKTFNEKTYITSDNIIKGDLSFTVPMNTAANLENNTTRLNTIEDYVDDNKNNIDKISKLEEGVVTSSLNIIDLQKDIKNDNDYTHYEGTNITINNLSKDSRTSNMIIKGQTLQNIFPTDPQKLGLRYASIEGSTIIMNPIAGSWSNAFDPNNSLWKTNTKYTVIIDIIENTLVKTENSAAGSLIVGNESDESVFDSLQLLLINVDNNVKGTYKKVLTTQKSFDSLSRNQGARIFLTNTYSGGQLKFKVTILEGDLTEENIPNYFEGIKSSGELEDNNIKILSCGKNLFNPKEFITGERNGVTYVVDNDCIILNGKTKVSDVELISFDNYINIDIDKRYKISYKKISGSTNNDDIRLACKNGSNWIISPANNKNVATIANSSSRKLERIRFFVPENTVFNNFKICIQLEEQDTNTEYEPYVSNLKSILVKEPLRGINNICDIMYQQNMAIKINRNIANFNFKGNETEWQLQSINDHEIANFRMPLNNVKGRNALCDKLIQQSTVIAETTGEGFHVSEGNGIYIRIRKTTASTIDQFKTWLKNNPINIVCDLINPVTEIVGDCLDINFNIYKNKTHIKCLNNISSELNFVIPNNLSTQIKENINHINKNSNSLNLLNDKASNLEAAQLSTALNVLELQKHTSMLDNGEINEYKNHIGTFVECNNTLDSRTENMRIGGRTLVNLVKYRLNNQKVGNPSLSATLCTNEMFKTNTTYTIIYTINSIETGTGKTTLNFSGGMSAPDIILNSSNLVGTHKQTFTLSTMPSVTHKNVSLYHIDRSTVKFFSDVLIVEGEIDFIPSYFEGIKSFGEAEGNKISILSGGLNRCTNESINGFININVNNAIQPDTTAISYIAKVYKGGTYYLNKTGGDRSVLGYFKSYPKIGDVALNVASGSIIVPSHGYIVAYVSSNKNTNNPTNIMISENASADFQPYKSNKKDILIKEPLREGDIMYEDNGQVKVCRKSYEYTLNGENEDWIVWTNSTGDTVNAYVYFNRMTPNLSGIVKPNSSNTNDRLPANQGGYLSTKEGFKITSEYFAISIHKSKLGVTNVNDPNNSTLIKKWLKENPITMICQLATPTIEIIDSIDINVDTYKDKTYITTDNEIQGELEFKTQNNFGAIMKNVNRCISKIFNSLNNILNIKGE